MKTKVIQSSFSLEDVKDDWGYAGFSSKLEN